MYGEAQFNWIEYNYRLKSEEISLTLTINELIILHNSIDFFTPSQFMNKQLKSKIENLMDKVVKGKANKS